MFCFRFQEFVSDLENFRGLEIIGRRREFYVVNQTESFHFISRLWKPIITSYWLVCCYILHSCDDGIEFQANALIRSCQEFALKLFLKGNDGPVRLTSLYIDHRGAYCKPRERQTMNCKYALSDTCR